MDERRTLFFLGWGVGGVVGLMFLLNAIALASISAVHQSNGVRLAASSARPLSMQAPQVLVRRPTAAATKGS